MQGDNPISWLMFFTLFAGVFVIAGAFIYFLRSRTNREIAADALEGDGRGRGMAPSGAGPELIGFAAIALAVMGLLATGYSRKSSFETAQVTTPVGGTAKGTTTGMAQEKGIADHPKTYQPANPAPDTRAAPTGSDTGVGSENGTTGQPK
jgi:ABC-type transport system involved in cytochrome c biogenesis permease subunit